MSDIFISYSRFDREFVDRLINELECRGFDVWLDRKDISGGSDWRAAIVNAIRSCSAFLVILSSNSANSKKVIQELSLADEHGRQIIPIVYESCEIVPEMDLQLATLQRIDFAGLPFAKAVDQVEAALTKKSSTKQKDNFLSDEQWQTELTKKRQKQSIDHSNIDDSADLTIILPGVWQVQITHTLTGMVGNLNIQLMPNGMFSGQLLGPLGQTAVQGIWQVTPLKQLVLQGQQTNGFQVIPYGVLLQFNSISSHSLTGLTGGGEQVVCRKIG